MSRARIPRLARGVMPVVVSSSPELSVDGIMFGDDWGDQRGVMLGAERYVLRSQDAHLQAVVLVRVLESPWPPEVLQVSETVEISTDLRKVPLVVQIIDWIDILAAHVIEGSDIRALDQTEILQAPGRLLE